MNPLDVREIMGILPHRYPLLLLDRVLVLEPLKYARGYKNITVNEAVFTGHFPGNPVMPGIYIIEALAQLGGTVVLASGDDARKVPYLAGIDKAKFRRPVVPGDQLMMEATLLRSKLNMGVVAVKAEVDGNFVCSAELMFSITADSSSFKNDASILHL